MKLNKGMKDDGLDPVSELPTKLRWDLLPLEEIEGIVEILTFGANKYTDNSWQQVDNGIERYYAALMRHIVAWRKGEDLDNESGFHHLKHVATNIIFLLYLTNKKNNETKIS